MCVLCTEKSEILVRKMWKKILKTLLISIVILLRKIMFVYLCTKFDGKMCSIFIVTKILTFESPCIIHYNYNTS